MLAGKHAGQAVPLPRLPLEMDSERLELTRDPPGVGEHTREIARLANLSEDEVDALIAEGVLMASDSG